MLEKDKEWIRQRERDGETGRQEEQTDSKPFVGHHWEYLRHQLLGLKIVGKKERNKAFIPCMSCINYISW